MSCLDCLHFLKPAGLVNTNHSMTRLVLNTTLYIPNVNIFIIPSFQSLITSYIHLRHVFFHFWFLLKVNLVIASGIFFELYNCRRF